MDDNIDISESRAYLYAKWCIEKDNHYVGRYIKKQAEKWLYIADNKNEFAYIDLKFYKKVCDILKLMIHPDLNGNITMYEGMEDYQWFFITAILCTKSRNDERRYYRTALLEISRKNFKTFVSAIIFIIGMLLEPKFSRFFSVAPDYKLSSELKLAVKKIIKVSPALVKHFKINRDLILCKLTEIEYTPLAYSNDGMDGKLANIFLADEAGALDSYPVEAMRSSQITLFNKLGIIISTQYPNNDNVMIDEIDIAKKVLNDLIEKKDYFALLYEPDEEIIKEWETNDLVIFQSNPIVCSMPEVLETLKESRQMAILYDNKRENYLCKHNNIMYKGIGTEGFIDIEKVQKCVTEENLKFWEGKDVYIGLDLSQSDDNTAVAMVTEANGIVYCKVWGFVPTDNIARKSKKEGVNYKKLINQHVCYSCGDEIIDYSVIEDFIINIEDNYKVNILQIGYDRYNAMSTVQKLESAGYETIEIKQHSSVLHMPIKLLYELILSKKFRYEKNPLLEINFQNARCTEDTNKNKYINKKRSNGKVDMVIALVDALYLLQQEQLARKDCSIIVI